MTDDAMQQLISDYEDVSIYDLTDDLEKQMLDEQIECVFMWATKDGWPVGVVMNYVVKDGKFWLTATSQRARMKAVARDPRVSLAFTSVGTDMGGGKTVTYKGMATLHEDDETKEWFFEALAQKLFEAMPDFADVFEEFLNSPRRMVIEVEPTKRIGFNGAEMMGKTAKVLQDRQAAKD